MIDWTTKVNELKHIADELDLLASRADGRFKLMAGRIADELRQFAHQIDRELNPSNGVSEQAMPDWLTENLDPELFYRQEDESALATSDEWVNQDWNDAGDYEEDEQHYEDMTDEDQ